MITITTRRAARGGAPSVAITGGTSASAGRAISRSYM